MQCWSCATVSEDEASLFHCPSCGSIQPPAPRTSHFDRLGVNPTVELLADDLARRFRALSRELHPDRYAGRSARERRLAVEQMTAVNDAYRTLRDPVQRATHLLHLRGVEIAERGGDAEPALLMEVMELRERIEEGEGWPELVAEIRSGIDRCLAEIGDVASAGAPLDETGRHRGLRALTRLKYLSSANADLERRLERETEQR